MPPKKKKSLSKVAAAPSILEQLTQLRAFVGSDSAFSESDLTDCLRQTGYSVDRAAELLITGQFQSRRSSSKKKSGKSAFFAAAEPGVAFKNGSVAAPKKNAQQPKISNHAVASKKASSSTAPQKENRSNKTTTDKQKDDSISSSNPKNAPRNSNHQDNEGEEPRHKLLLCRRWVSDCVVTSRHGRVDHTHPLTLEHSKTGPAVVRFRGPSSCSHKSSPVEGRLPPTLAALLTPLWRYDQDMLEVHAQSLEGGTPNWGSNLPVDLRIYVTRPRQFFATMMTSEDNNLTSKAAQYFQLKEEAARKGPSNKTKKLMSAKEAAFHLLQWAEYGDVPEFPQPNQEEEKPAADTADSAQNDDDDDNLQEMDEDDFEAASADTAQGLKLEGSVVVPEETAHANLDEMDDPVGLAEHVTLRPYQKQALHFMMQRETSGESRKEIDQQLQLLQELSAEQRKKQMGSCSSSSSMDCFVVQTKEIVCDIGPVVVTEAGQKKSTTLDGQVNPVNHPLWKRRFLAEPDFSRSISFYVNELLGVATFRPPEPPKPCSGGILGDAMGLVRTVLVILKSGHFILHLRLLSDFCSFFFP